MRTWGGNSFSSVISDNNLWSHKHWNINGTSCNIIKMLCYNGLSAECYTSFLEYFIRHLYQSFIIICKQVSSVTELCKSVYCYKCLSECYRGLRMCYESLWKCYNGLRECLLLEVCIRIVQMFMNVLQRFAWVFTVRNVYQSVT